MAESLTSIFRARGLCDYSRILAQDLPEEPVLLKWLRREEVKRFSQWLHLLYPSLLLTDI
jgi:hypothetical protein